MKLHFHEIIWLLKFIKRLRTLVGNSGLDVKNHLTNFSYQLVMFLLDSVT